MPRRRPAAADSNKTPKRGISDRALIRELFIQRVPLYSFADVLRLTRTAQAEVDAAIADGGITTETFSGSSLRGTTSPGSRSTGGRRG